MNQTSNARKVFDSMGIKYSEEEVLSVRVSDRPGSLGRVTRKVTEKPLARVKTVSAASLSMDGI